MSSRLSAADVALLDELALVAWPAPVQETLGGWVLRFGHGVTGRANSVWPNRDNGTIALDKKIAAAEAFYERHGLVPRFQISPACVPPDLDQTLAERGYGASARTLIQTARIEQVDESHAALSAAPDDAWLETWLAGKGYDRAPALAAAPGVFSASGAFARLPAEGPPLAVGRAVAERGWVGIFAMQTRPEARRRGLARQILDALLRWGVTQEAERAYLQVEEANATARALYEQYGFETGYSYRYRVRR